MWTKQLSQLTMAEVIGERYRLHNLRYYNYTLEHIDPPEELLADIEQCKDEIQTQV